METKSGDVSHIASHDLTKFNMNDLIVGDKDGQLTIFSNKLLLSSYKAHSPITSMTVDVGHRMNNYFLEYCIVVNILLILYLKMEINQ